MRRPSWLLALVTLATLVSVIALIETNHEDNVHEVMEVCIPLLAALFVVDRVDKRSDKQDEQLRENHAATRQNSEAIHAVHQQVNGGLTKRLDDAQPDLRAEVHRIRTDQIARQQAEGTEDPPGAS